MLPGAPPPGSVRDVDSSSTSSTSLLNLRKNSARHGPLKIPPRHQGLGTRHGDIIGLGRRHQPHIYDEIVTTLSSTQGRFGLGGLFVRQIIGLARGFFTPFHLLFLSSFFCCVGHTLHMVGWQTCQYIILLAAFLGYVRHDLSACSFVLSKNAT